MTVGGSGDVLVHRSVRQQAADNAGGDGFDFGPMFAPVADLISAVDVALCHQETPVSKDNGYFPASGPLTFIAPMELTDALAEAGFDGCDTVSNHVWDDGLRGITSTAARMESSGLAMAGPTTPDAVDDWPVLDANGLNVAHLAYTYSVLNSGSPNADVPQKARWLAAYSWPALGTEGIIADARAAKAAGADLVVVSMHWGLEYQVKPTADQRRYARALLESGEVDLILGAHAHVVQTCEKVNGRYVVYGMGNFLSNQHQSSIMPTRSQDGVWVVASLTLDEAGELSSELAYQPTWVERGAGGWAIVPATPDNHPESYARTAEQLNACGATPLG